MKTITNLLFTITFFVVNISFGQQNTSGVCKLGKITNDSLYAYIDSLELDCSSGDPIKFKTHYNQFHLLKYIILKGDVNIPAWSELFMEIKEGIPSIKTIVFDQNTFHELPVGFEKLYNIEKLTISNNEGLDYNEVVQQLSELPNLREFALDIYSIYDLPENLLTLKNINKIYLTNREEIDSADISFSTSPGIKLYTYDFSVNKGDNYTAIKYITAEKTLDKDEYEELNKRFKTNNNLKSTSLAKAGNVYKPLYTHVKPPIPGLDVERNFYIINPEIDNVILYPSGTKILIPANAFTDSSKNLVKESITISYREFRDPVDFMVSGIPMKYDSAGSVNHFESAGMFEINASIKGQPLNLISDKKIQMNFATTSPDSTYNFYGFNDSTGNWNYKTKPRTINSQNQIRFPSFSNAYYVYNEFIHNNKRIQDSLPFNERFESPAYTYLYRKDTSQSSGDRVFWCPSKRTFHRKSTSSLIKIKSLRKTKDGTIFFRLRFLDGAHPELKEFNNYYFALNDIMALSDFKEKYYYKKSFNDIRIYSDGHDFQLKLKDAKGFNIISTHIVTIDDHQKIKEVKSTKSIAKKYNNSLNDREYTFNKKTLKKKYDEDNYITQNPDRLNYLAFEKAKTGMNDMEKKMNYDEWLSYYNQIDSQIVAYQKKSIYYNKIYADSAKINLKNAEATAENLVQSLSLDGMGIYNCDQIQRIKDPVEIFATYQSIKSENVNPSSTYIIDKNRNAVLQYDGYKGFSANKIAFSNSKYARNILIAVGWDGSIAVFKSEEFKKNTFKNRAKFNFTVTGINSKLTSVAELKKIIGL